MTYRYRSDGTTVPSALVQEYYYPWGGSPTLNATYSKIGVGSNRAMRDVVVPNFYSRRSRGEVFFNPLRSVKNISEDHGGAGYVISAGAPHTNHWDSTGSVLAHLLSLKYALGTTDIPPVSSALSQSDISSLENEVGTRCLSVRTSPSQNLSEDLVQFGQTLDLIHKPLQSLSVLSRKLPISTSVLAASNAWLQYRYGVRPLIEDIDSILKARKVHTHTRRRRTDAARTLIGSSNSSYNQTFGISKCTTNLSVSDKVQVRAVSLDLFQDTGLFESGISFSGLVTLPWELIPYSFVADWFVNVQDFLSASLPSPFFTSLGNCLVTKRDIVCSWSLVNQVSTNPTYTITQGSTGSFVVTQTSTIRRPISNPSLVIKSDFRFDKLDRTLDAFSLIYQKFAKVFLYRGK